MTRVVAIFIILQISKYPLIPTNTNGLIRTCIFEFRVQFGSFKTYVYAIITFLGRLM